MTMPKPRPTRPSPPCRLARLAGPRPGQRSGRRVGRACVLALAGLLLSADMALADCTDAPAPEVNWRRCVLDGYVARGEDLSRADLRDARLNRSIFTDSIMAELNGRRVKLVSADLTGVTFDGANLVEADLSLADLQGASLRGTDLTRAKLYRAIVREADLTGARLDRADLHLADFSGSTWIDGRTICAEGSIGRCNPSVGQESVGELGASG
jgi:uncharacterized protein YjbI with pentapeptide repeats